MTELAKATGKDRFRALKEASTNFSLIIGVLIVTAILLVVLIGPLFAPYNPYLVDRVVKEHYDFEQEVYIRLPLKPSPGFPLGTNELGMDILSLLLHGARNTLIAGVLITAARVLIGLFIGLASGWYEGRLFDRAVMGLIGVLTSLPMLISGLILVFAIGVGGGMLTFFVALSLVGWTEVAQYIRGEVLVARKMPYIEAARSIGLRELEIAIRHVIPNILPQLFVIAFLEVGAVLMLLGELALIGVFIGGGGSLDFSDIMAPPNIVAIPSQPEWGAMIASGFRWFRSNPHIVMVPASAVFIAVLGFNAIGEGLRTLFENRGIKTSFILSRKMIGLLAIVFLGMYAVFQSTQPSQFYDEMSNNFQGNNVLMHEQALQNLALQSAPRDEPLPAAAYLAENFFEYGVKGGVRWSKYYSMRHSALFTPATEPEFSILDREGNLSRSFGYQSEFAYVVDSYGGAGKVSAPLVALNLAPNSSRNVGVDMYGGGGEGTTAVSIFDLSADLSPYALTVMDEFSSSIKGKIVMMWEGNASPKMAEALIERGALGILWISRESGSLQDASLEVSVLDEEVEALSKVPVYRINSQTAEDIIAEAGLRGELIFTEGADPDSDAKPWTFKELDVSLQMELQLDSPSEIEITSVVAYLPGTDADLGDEIIVLVTSCAGLWRSDEQIDYPSVNSKQSCAAANMLELARLWDENLIDNRRPILFIVWGGAEFSPYGLSEWLTDRYHFSHLSAPGMRLFPRPAILIQLVNNGRDGEQIAVDSQSSEDVIRVFDESARRNKLDLGRIEEPFSMPMWLPRAQLPFQAALDLKLIAAGESEEQIAEIQKVGESFSLAMIRMVRESILNSD